MFKTPVELLLQYRDEVYKASVSKAPRECFDFLCGEHSEFSEISYNSFRSYLRLFKSFYEFYEPKLVAAELLASSVDNSSGHGPEQKESGNVPFRGSPEGHSENGPFLGSPEGHSEKVAINIAGWTVNQSKTDCYYRATRTVNGRGRSVYLGKLYEPVSFLAKLQLKNEEYGLPDTPTYRKGAANKCKIHLKRKSYSLPAIRRLCRRFIDSGTGYPTFDLRGSCSWSGCNEHPGWFDLTRTDLDTLILEGTLVSRCGDDGFYVPVGFSEK